LTASEVYNIYKIIPPDDGLERQKRIVIVAKVVALDEIIVNLVTHATGSGQQTVFKQIWFQ
jgi:hypothetical protein